MSAYPFTPGQFAPALCGPSIAEERDDRWIEDYCARDNAEIAADYARYRGQTQVDALAELACEDGEFLAWLLREGA